VSIVFLILFTHCSLTFSHLFISDDDDVKPLASHARVPREIEVVVVARKKQKSGVDRVWERTISRNERNKLMDIDKNNLTREQKKQRKSAKNTSKSMLKNAANKQLHPKPQKYRSRGHTHLFWVSSHPTLWRVTLNCVGFARSQGEADTSIWHATPKS
jgi:hypothetical protein